MCNVNMYFFPKFVDITMIYFEQHLSMMVFSSWVIAGVRAVYTVGVNSSPSVVSTWGSNDRSVITRSDHIGGGGGYSVQYVSAAFPLEVYTPIYGVKRVTSVIAACIFSDSESFTSFYSHPVKYFTGVKRYLSVFAILLLVASCDAIIWSF